ncbi:uncharacterized protein UV8b_05257 [Ustilaginoidea virens]|uniref:Uncharacterized protein n=1 Tax=Ustilaginoidea virens TaxID=1159556 RepID=A0A8E5MIH0_USTVR|nr:uncharacterized protein UV8b_05257 [Ustilaginoidea virens]QUC21016.1 hypothetical protein UV8b_05257 [Ustilaginoidea virens]
MADGRRQTADGRRQTADGHSFNCLKLQLLHALLPTTLHPLVGERRLTTLPLPDPPVARPVCRWTNLSSSAWYFSSAAARRPSPAARQQIRARSNVQGCRVAGLQGSPPCPTQAQASPHYLHTRADKGLSSGKQFQLCSGMAVLQFCSGSRNGG